MIKSIWISDRSVWISDKEQSWCSNDFYIPPSVSHIPHVLATVSCRLILPYESSPSSVICIVCSNPPIRFLSSHIHYIQADRRVPATAWGLRSVVKKTGSEYTFNLAVINMVFGEMFFSFQKALLHYHLKTKRWCSQKSSFDLGAVCCTTPSYLECRGIIYLFIFKKYEEDELTSSGGTIQGFP